MDELTERILAAEEDRKAHPEDWKVIIECRGCGATREVPVNKEEVQKYRDEHGTNVMTTSACLKCEPEEAEED